MIGKVSAAKLVGAMLLLKGENSIEVKEDNISGLMGGCFLLTLIVLA